MIGAFLLAAAAGMCEPPRPAAAADPETAAAYLEVGDAELQAGALDTAAVAYSEALRLDPGSERARGAYHSACLAQHRDQLLVEGRRLLDAGDRAAAIAILEELRAGRGDAAAALLEGIALYEDGSDEAARLPLAEAAQSEATAARAQYFLGLIELRDGSGVEAARLFDRVAAAEGGSLVERAEVLRETALRSGRAVVSVLAESGYDSNVAYAPDVRPATGDGGAGGGLFGQLRPFGLSGPYLRANAFVRQQFQARDRNLGVFGGQAGWRLGRGETYAFGDYGYELTTLGGSPYLSAHRFRAGARWQRFGRWAVAGVYALRLGAYQTPDSSDFSGVLHSLSPEISYRFPLGSSITAGYDVLRDSAQLAETSFWEQGPRAGFSLVVLPRLRASLEAGLRFRSHDGPAPGALAARTDQVRYASATAEQDFGRLTLRLALGARTSSSSDPGASWSRFTATLGVSYTLGLF